MIRPNLLVVSDLHLGEDLKPNATSASSLRRGAKLERELRYTETTSVTIRDTNRVGDYVCEVRRDPDVITVSLRTLWRLHAEDAFVIMVEGALGPPPDVDRVRLRINGVFKQDTLGWRITDEGKVVFKTEDERNSSELQGKKARIRAKDENQSAAAAE